MIHQFYRPIVILCLFALTGSRLAAQDQAAQIQTQHDLATRPEPQAETDLTPESVADPELGEIGVVNRRKKPKMFTFSTSQSLNFTSNAFLTQANERTAFFWNGRFDASFVPYATRNFTPRLTFEQTLFRYDHFSELDFDSQALRLDLRYNLTPDASWFLNGSYSRTRLFSQHPSIGEFYKFGLLEGSLTRFAPLGNLPLYLGTTGGIYWRQGDPSAFDRVSGYLSALLISNLRENVQLSVFARPELQIYTNDAVRTTREDFNVSVGATASWSPLEYVTLSTTAAYVGNFSSVGPRRYDVLMPAIVVSASIAF